MTSEYNWFAWFPVTTDKGLVWLETVDRIEERKEIELPFWLFDDDPRVLLISYSVYVYKKINK